MDRGTWQATVHGVLTGTGGSDGKESACNAGDLGLIPGSGRSPGWISLQSKGLSKVFSNTTVQKHQFFGTQLSSQSTSHTRKQSSLSGKESAQGCIPQRLLGRPDYTDSKESACNVGNLGSVPELGRSPGGGHGNPLQYYWASLVAQMSMSSSNCCFLTAYRFHRRR